MALPIGRWFVFFSAQSAGFVEEARVGAAAEVQNQFRKQSIRKALGLKLFLLDCRVCARQRNLRDQSKLMEEDLKKLIWEGI